MRLAAEEPIYSQMQMRVWMQTTISQCSGAASYHTHHVFWSLLQEPTFATYSAAEQVKPEQNGQPSWTSTKSLE
jgi:hypothetical protein